MLVIFKVLVLCLIEVVGGFMWYWSGWDYVVVYCIKVLILI